MRLDRVVQEEEAVAMEQPIMATKKRLYHPPERSETSKEIDRAISAIYRTYGADLSAFMSNIRQKQGVEELTSARKKAKRK